MQTRKQTLMTRLATFVVLMPLACFPDPIFNSAALCLFCGATLYEEWRWPRIVRRNMRRFLTGPNSPYPELIAKENRYVG